MRPMISRLLDGHAADWPGRRAIVLPTTPDTLHWADQQLQSGAVQALAGEWASGPSSESTLLHRIGQLSPSEPFTLIVFHDQFVSADQARALVNWQGRAFFLGELEATLNTEHRFTIRLQTDRQVRTYPPGSPREHLMRGLCLHLETCQQLGDDWLARSAQSQRQLEFRRHDSLTRLRDFYSAAMHLSLRHTSPPSPILSRVLTWAYELEQQIASKDE